MVKPDDSAKEVIKRHRQLVPVFCKVCKRLSGFAEHEGVNMFICKDNGCDIWYNRQIFKARYKDHFAVVK